MARRAMLASAANAAAQCLPESSFCRSQTRDGTASLRHEDAPTDGHATDLLGTAVLIATATITVALSIIAQRRHARHSACAPVTRRHGKKRRKLCTSPSTLIPPSACNGTRGAPDKLLSVAAAVLVSDVPASPTTPTEAGCCDSPPRGLHSRRIAPNAEAAGAQSESQSVTGDGVVTETPTGSPAEEAAPSAEPAPSVDERSADAALPGPKVALRASAPAPSPDARQRQRQRQRNKPSPMQTPRTPAPPPPLTLPRAPPPAALAPLPARPPTSPPAPQPPVPHKRAIAAQPCVQQPPRGAAANGHGDRPNGRVNGRSRERPSDDTAACQLVAPSQSDPQVESTGGGMGEVDGTPRWQRLVQASASECADATCERAGSAGGHADGRANSKAAAARQTPPPPGPPPAPSTRARGILANGHVANGEHRANGHANGHGDGAASASPAAALPRRMTTRGGRGGRGCGGRTPRGAEPARAPAATSASVLLPAATPAKIDASLASASPPASHDADDLCFDGLKKKNRAAQARRVARELAEVGSPSFKVPAFNFPDCDPHRQRRWVPARASQLYELSPQTVA